METQGLNIFQKIKAYFSKDPIIEHYKHENAKLQKELVKVHNKLIKVSKKLNELQENGEDR